MRTVNIFVTVLAGLLLTCCTVRPVPVTASDIVLKAYTEFNGTSRHIDPVEFIAWLKANRFTHGELNDLPPFAIILHHADVRAHLRSLGIDEQSIMCLDIGETDPSIVCRVTVSGRPPLLVARGMPGAGGVATEAAELSALGADYVVHIGTAAVLGSVSDVKPIISTGSYKDGAALLLSPLSDVGLPISEPDTQLSSLITEELSRVVSVRRGIGFTIPIFYYQPEGLIFALINGSEFASHRPIYIEMEGAPLFETARHARIHCASVVIPSDAYSITNGKVEHSWLGDTSALERQATEAVWAAFTRIALPPTLYSSQANTEAPMQR